MKSPILEKLEQNRREFRAAQEAQLGQTREMLERTHAQDLVHEAERARWLEHVKTLHGHLYRLIDEKREWELEHRAFLSKSDCIDDWKEALPYYQPTRLS